MLKRRSVRSKVLVLTFDDGPGNRLTPAILEILKEHKVKATFFVLGRNIAGREAIVGRIVNEGHEICSHGYNHMHYWKVSPFRTISDIKKGWHAIDAVLSSKKQVYPLRPPGGKLNLICLLYLWIKKAPIYYWTIDSSDTWTVDKRSSKRTSRMIQHEQGGVVLVHDFDRTTADDVDNIVLDTVKSALSVAKKNGMGVITISELVGGRQER